MDEREDNLPGGSAEYSSAKQIVEIADGAAPITPDVGANSPRDPEDLLAHAREHLAGVVGGSEPEVPQLDVVLTPEIAAEVGNEVEPQRPRRGRAMAALLRAGRRMEEGALNVAAKVIVRNIEHASDKRLRHVDSRLNGVSPEQLADHDEQSAKYHEAQRLFLREPTEKRSIDESHGYHRWAERRQMQDPVVAAEVAAAEAPIQAQIDAITVTGLFGIEFSVRDKGGNFRTPFEYRGTHYEWKPGDPRFAHEQEVLDNNMRLMELIKEKLAARNAVLAEHSGKAEVQ